ncbi:glycosyltransferase family 2 protein [Bowmanella sp. JS7-9]|uniref:Glycosyltransferase family 2 protein n=1 Tax=Pseudobowmanella zhangzhouensis TaxID=1537679 RepID=A0ABW1XJ68_9ALTE|nr:glycosyltransferase family 2 protein [Bowmanella sp. JS7-9]TBX23098.1 dolichol-phosphate mannosyltransferase [Bowmanella sp. JS7-9]
MKAVSVVIPAKNEQDNIRPLVTEIVTALTPVQENFEIIYIDDGSDDNTLNVLKELQTEMGAQLQIVRHKNSCGQSTAVRSGVKAANYPWIVTLDADGQNDPADIPAMLVKAAQCQAQHFAVCGYRKNRKDTAWKRFQSRFANKIRSAMLGDGTPDTGCGLKIFPRETFLELPYFSHMHRFIPALVRRAGGEIIISVVHHRDRMAGVSKYNMLNRAWVGLVDIFGVMWLQKRSRIAEYIEP